MRNNERDLLLLPATGKVNKKRRYYSLKNAIRTAVHEMVGTNRPMLIYDTGRGQDVVSVFNARGDVVISKLVSTSRFKNLWSR